MRVRIILAALLAGSTIAGAAAADEPEFGACRRQIEDYVRQELGQTVTNVDIRSFRTYSKGPDDGDALAYVKECDGFHAFTVFGTDTVCEQIPHYGSGGYYVRYQGSYGGCRRPQ